MNVPTELKYTDNDEWIQVTANIGTIGITDHAQNQLSDIVYLELVLSPGEEGKKGDTCATIESVKSSADVFLPVSGTIIEINEALADTPDRINQDPYGEAWLIKIRLSDPGELDSLMDSGAYVTRIENKS